MGIRSIMSICSGIGGLDLGAHLANPGAKTICYLEREAYPAATLVARMEDQTLGKAPIWDDLTTFKGGPWRGKVDCIIAGFPCQPWSSAGKRKGIADDRWLWDDIWRIICAIRPKYIFLENVPGVLRGGIEHVFGSMAKDGYDAEWGCFSAGECGFAHKRERLFILGKLGNTKDEHDKGGLVKSQSGGFSDSSRKLAYSGGEGLQGSECGSPPDARRRAETLGSTPEFCGAYFLPKHGDAPGWRKQLEIEPYLKPAICRTIDGSPKWMVNANTYRADRIRALGNGVVPLVAAYAFKTLVKRFD